MNHALSIEVLSLFVVVIVLYAWTVGELSSLDIHELHS